MLWDRGELQVVPGGQVVEGLGTVPTTYASKREGAGVWQAARASLDGMDGSSRILGQ